MGNDQEIEFHEIEIGIFHEIEIGIFHEIEIGIFHEIESFFNKILHNCSGERKGPTGPRGYYFRVFFSDLT